MIRKIPIAPDPEDFTAVDAEYGPLPYDASEKQATDRYRLAQASKQIRTNSPAIIDRPLAAGWLLPHRQCSGGEGSIDPKPAGLTPRQ